jgi:hypothetical protein
MTSVRSERPSKSKFASASPSAIPIKGPYSIAINIAPMITAGEFWRRPKPASNVAAAFIVR